MAQKIFELFFENDSSLWPYKNQLPLIPLNRFTVHRIPVTLKGSVMLHSSMTTWTVMTLDFRGLHRSISVNLLQLQKLLLQRRAYFRAAGKVSSTGPDNQVKSKWFRGLPWIAELLQVYCERTMEATSNEEASEQLATDKEITGPFTLCCSKCRTTVGDSFSLL